MRGAEADGPSRQRPRVLIIEDHRVLAQALALSLGAKGFGCEVALLDGDVGVLEQARVYAPALALLDLDLNGADGLQLVPGLRALGAAVLVVTGYSDEARLAASVALGGCGWVSKAQPFEGLLEAAEMVLRGEALLGASEREQLRDLGWARLRAEDEARRRMALLTTREREVLDGLSGGCTAEEIARQLVVSVGTVRTHIRGILTKLGVSNQLAAVAKSRGLAAYR